MNQLRARVISILIAAAAPAILLVTALAYQTYESAKASAFEALQRDADLLAARFDAIPLGAARTSSMLATAVAWNPGINENCERDIEPILPIFPNFSAILVYRNSMLVCSRGSPLPEARHASLSQFGLAEVAPGRSRNGVIKDAANDLVMFGAARGNGDASPFAAILLIDNQFLDQLLGLFRSVDTSKALLVDGAGQRLGASRRLLDPQETPRFGAPAETAPVSFARDPLDRSYVLTTQKLTSQDVWLVTYQREADVLESARRQLILAVTAPLLTLLLVGLAAWLGLTRFVLRWINRLTRVTNAYAAGDVHARVGDASAAPGEIAQLAARFDGMADRMAERAVELENEVSERRRYIRELHHRVKNNLQVIASLLALQKRGLSGDQRSVLRFPEDRINAMAAAYGVSYAQTESGRVGALSVVREVITRLQSGIDNGHAHLRVTIAGEDREVDLDTAIAIAMLLAEFLPPFLDHSLDSNHLTAIDVSVSEKLVINVVGPASDPPADSLSERFARAYLRQLNAQVDERRPGRLVLRIPVGGTAMNAYATTRSPLAVDRS